MKILIVGAGVVGSIFGWALSGQNEVTHLVRPGRAARLAAGMPVDVVDRRPGQPKQVQGIYPIRVVETLQAGEAYDLVIIPTKHYMLEQTLSQIVPLTPQADYLLLTQNWQGTGFIDRLIDPGHYCFGDAKAGGSFVADQLVCTLKAIDIGSSNGQMNPSLQKCITLFALAGIPAHLQPEMLHYLWVQYAYTAGPWPVLVRAGSFKKLYSEKQSIEPILATIQECLRVVEARGVDLAHFSDMQMYSHPSKLTQLLAGLAMGWMFSHDEYRKRCSLHALADPTEVRTFYYDLLHTGQELNVPMPVFAGYEPDMQAFTQPGKAW
jgi:Ketopantoate reductase